MAIFAETFCSQCGGAFGPGDSGYSHCDQHAPKPEPIDFSCHVCGVQCDCAPNPPERAVCPEHCPDHLYDYDGMGGGHYCRNCGQPAPQDWLEPMEGDVLPRIEREPGERIGTPLSELSGQPGTPGYDKFVRIAKSWGYD